MIKKRVLFIALEFPYWSLARTWSYGAQLAFEGGLEENGVECFTVTTLWLPRIKEICKGMTFDQVWMEVVHSAIDETMLQWIAGLAPVRVGLIGESLEYDQTEHDIDPNSKNWYPNVERKLKYLTHIVAIDECDVRRFNESQKIRAMWWASAVPRQFVLGQNWGSVKKQGAFIGNAYYQRALMLEAPELKDILVKQRSPEDGTIYPFLFTTLHAVTIIYINSRLPGARLFLSKYLLCLRKLREKSHMLLLKAFRGYLAVVNLPCMVKAYPGRVIEGMASGRPVISWEIPNRPKNKALFADGEEILLFHEPHQLARHIRKLINDQEYAEKIASDARRNLLQNHTIEKRVEQILSWIETGVEPTYQRYQDLPHSIPETKS